MTSLSVEQENVGKRLDAFIQEKMPDFTRSHIQKLISSGNIKVDGKIVKSGLKLKQGQNITFVIPEPETLDASPEDIKIDIVYQDDDLAVINKPRGMVVHPANGNKSGTLVNALLYHLKNLSAINGVIRPGIVHRLDKDTTGLLIVAKNDAAHINLAKQIETKSCHRYYLAICCGNFKQDQGIIKTGYERSRNNRKQMAVAPLGQGKTAETHYRVIERYGNYTLVEFKLQTGRTHQIRVHCKYMGHPIACDPVYGHKDKFLKADGQLLHAYKIEFNQPTTNKQITLQADLPEDFKKSLNWLRQKI